MKTLTPKHATKTKLMKLRWQMGAGFRSNHDNLVLNAYDKYRMILQLKVRPRADYLHLDEVRKTPAHLR